MPVSSRTDAASRPQLLPVPHSHHHHHALHEHHQPHDMGTTAPGACITKRMLTSVKVPRVDEPFSSVASSSAYAVKP
jgi:hypothetical protein